MLVAANEPHTFPMRFIQHSSVLLRSVTKTCPLTLVLSLSSLKKRRRLVRPRYRDTLQVLRPRVLTIYFAKS